ncbi:MAG: hypothetical protein FH758_07910 [Firmicutes bacterium]|nr:hypothetical protein [Bacillota bacterium]
MTRNDKYIFLLLGLIFIIGLFVVFIKEETVKTIQRVESVTTRDLTLLERKYEDVDSDNKKESIELYNSAQWQPDGSMGWDTGHNWLLIVRKDETVYPLFDDWVQHGELNFWIVAFNKSQVEGPESTDLERHIYVMETRGIKLFDYHWDKQSLCYKKEIVFNPPNQWYGRSSSKYSSYSPTMIEPQVLKD